MIAESSSRTRRSAPNQASPDACEARLFLGLFTLELAVAVAVAVAIGAGVALVPGNLITLLVNTQILNGIITWSRLASSSPSPTAKASSATPPTARSSASWPLLR